MSTVTKDCDGQELRRGKRGESRLPPAIAVVAGAALYTLLPDDLQFAPRLVVPLEIGFSFFEGRRVRVLDNRDRTHTGWH